MGDFYATDVFHSLFPFLLFFEEFAFSADVAAVAFGDDVFSEGFDGVGGDDFLADGGLDTDFVLLPGDDFFELFDDGFSAVVAELAVDDEGEGVYGVAVEEDVDFDEVAGGVVGEFVVEAGVAFGGGLEFVEEVEEDFAEGEVVVEDGPHLGGVFGAFVDAPAVLAEVHDGPDVVVGHHDGGVDHRFFDFCDVVAGGKFAGVADVFGFAVGGVDEVIDAGGGEDEVEVEFPFEAFAGDFHVEEAEEAAPETEAKGGGGFGFKFEA